MSVPLSVTVVTLNAGHQIEACLRSVAWADELLVVDSGSTDDTVAIAERCGARVVHQQWLGYGPQKRFATASARNDWVLSVDADERVSPELRLAIGAVLQSPTCAGYRFRRCNRFMGRWLRHGEGYPDWSLRLYDRNRGNWSADPVHERVEVSGLVQTIDGDLLHESADTLSAYLAKQNRYTTLQAEQLHARGRRGSVMKLVLSPPIRFLKFYVLRQGFRDGVPGLVHILIGCFNTAMKNAKLLELDRSGRAS
ncbi:MAG: glycosyltransferase family 2 protein [Burkholderiales bacterium]|nr:glycosyltransferase family 2 protein [Burkholderiales bacterium]